MKFSFLLLLVVNTIVLTGCGPSSSPPATPPEQQASQQQAAINRIQNDSKMPPEVKAKVVEQMQTEAARQQNAR